MPTKNKNIENFPGEIITEKLSEKNAQPNNKHISKEVDNAEDTVRALLNVLDDFSAEKVDMEDTQHAVLNILDDYSEEKRKVEFTNSYLITANSELEQFAYIASHDLQEPLLTITNFVGLFEKKYSERLDENAQQYLQFIVLATTKMQRLIKHLLDFSRVGRDISFGVVHCNKVLEKVIAELKPFILESKAKITFSSLPVLKGSEIEMERLFFNLISNAIKFRKKNIIPEVTITAEEKETEFIFAIKDNGIGMEKKYFGKIFTIFQRLPNASEYKGSGIGLATVKKIVNLHGGKVWVESTLGVGSTFYFNIPKEI